VDDLLLDACVALNLLASGIELGELAGASNVRFLMTTVVAAETLWIDPLDPAGQRERIDNESLGARGITLVALNDDELERFVDLARSIDDGEAATIAVAIHRGLRVATDDRKAHRLAISQLPPIEIVGTTELVRRWADSASTAGTRVVDAVRSIEVRASFFPPRDDPLLGWWNSVMAR
jgi:hypothetical protein